MTVAFSTSLAEYIVGVLHGKNELAIVNQPIVDLESGRVVGYEALSRFANGMGPDRVFGAANSLGLGKDLELFALRAALKGLVKLPAGQRLHVNISPALLGAPEVEDLFLAYDLGRVTIELTEHEPVVDYSQVARVLDLFRERGARVAVDDLGSGYGGLEIVISTRPELVKLDRSFVAGIDRSNSQSNVMASLIRFVTSFGGEVVAEGVESVAEIEQVSRLGARFAQGYAIGAPQVGFPPVDRSRVAGAARQARRVIYGGELVDFIERVPIARDTATLLGSSLGVVVDVYRRPLFLWVHWEDGGRALSCSEVEVGSSVELCRRIALNRPASQRLNPLVVVDGSRRTVGVLRVENLLGESGSGP